MISFWKNALWRAKYIQKYVNRPQRMEVMVLNYFTWIFKGSFVILVLALAFSFCLFFKLLSFLQ